MHSNMRNRLSAATALAVGLLLVSRAALPHHGANLYDMTKAVALKGTITKFVWGNPHNQIFFDVTDEKGEVAHWVASTEPPLVMLERGWTVKSLNPGDQVTAYVYAAKNGAPVGNLQKVVLVNGKELTAYQGGRGAGPEPPQR